MQKGKEWAYKKISIMFWKIGSCDTGYRQTQKKLPVFINSQAEYIVEKSYRYPRIYIVERIRISYFFALSRITRFYATTMQKFIHSCLENSQENQPITPKFVLYIVYILHYTKQSLDLPISIGSMEKGFLIFFCITPCTRKIKKKEQQSFIHLKTY